MFVCARFFFFKACVCLCMCLFLDIQASYFSTTFSSPHVVTVTQGVPANISCGTFVSVPAYSVTWIQAHSLLTTSDQVLVSSREVVHRDGYLLLIEPMLTDNGKIYRCLVQNGFTNSPSQGFVQVLVEREFASQLNFSVFGCYEYNTIIT